MNTENPQKLSLFYHDDKRGTLFEVLSSNIVEKFHCNHAYISESFKHVVRGFHQQYPSLQVKLIWCLDGEINDHIVNLRSSDANFGRISSYNLRKGEGIYIPSHFAHGFECLSEKCTLLYLCDLPYCANEQIIINPFSVEFEKLWQSKKPIISERDYSGGNLNAVRQLNI